MNLDLEALWTPAEAAEHAGVLPKTVRMWIYRGHLPVAERDRRTNGPLLRPLDVARAEAKTRTHARRTVEVHRTAAA
jgi:predicted site-specific integrase-resolvase